MVRVGVDVIVTTGGNPAALAAKRAAPAIPIVMAHSGDPVGAGLVATLARPGSNITGISMNVGPEIYAKRLGLLKGAAARITRVGVISRMIEYRSAEGKLERLPALAAELVALKVDVIVAAGGAPGALAAKQATRTLPIVFHAVGDPVASRIVTNLARPDGDVTGLSILDRELINLGSSCGQATSVPSGAG